MYWESLGDCSIQFARADLDGSDVEHVPVYGYPDVPTGLVVDSTSGKLYWISGRIGPLPHPVSIRRTNPDGTGLETLVEGIPASDLTLDFSTGRMYWSEYAAGVIRRANLDGSGVEDVLTGLDGPNALALDPAGGKLYWSEPGAGRIRRADLDGTGAEDVFTGLNLGGLGFSPGDLAFVLVGVGSPVEPPSDLPKQLRLGQNFPNPFHPETTIEYALDRTRYVRLVVIDLLGREVAVLVEGIRAGGPHQVRFDGSRLPGGVYLYRLTAGEVVETRRMVLLK
jgi:hypothetical protein